MKTDQGPAQRFNSPPSFHDPKPAPIIDGLKPGDAGYMEAWAKKNGVPFKPSD